MSINKGILIVFFPIIVFAHFSFSGSYYIQNYNYSDYGNSMDGYDMEEYEIFVAQEYAFKIKYESQGLEKYALMNIYNPAYIIRGSQGNAKYFYNYSISDYSSDSLYSRSFSFQFKSVGLKAYVTKYIAITADYYYFHSANTNLQNEYLNYSTSIMIPFYPVYVKCMFESDIYFEINNYYELGILYSNTDYNIALSLGNGKQYSLRFDTFLYNRLLGFECAYMNLYYNDRYRIFNMADLDDDKYAIMIGNHFDSEHIGWKLMGGFNSRYRLILIPELSIRYPHLYVNINSTIASFANIIDGDHASSGNSDNFISCSVELSYLF